MKYIIINQCYDKSTTDVLPEDSGNYTCEVRDANSGIIGSVTHQVYIRS